MIVLIFILIDIRINPQKIDIDYINFFGNRKLPINIIFTKCDKKNSTSINYNIDKFNYELENYWSKVPKYFISSSNKKIGKEEILKYVKEVNDSLNL